MKFINNTSSSVYLYCQSYATPTGSATLDLTAMYIIEPGETLSVYFPRDASYIVFRGHMGSASGACLIPYINGVATDGNSDYRAAMNDPTTIDTVGERIIEFNASSSTVSNSTRWAIHTTAIPDIVGKSYQLNASLTGRMAATIGHANNTIPLIGTIKNNTLEHEFNLTEPRLHISGWAVRCFTADATNFYIPNYFPSFFYNFEVGDYWNIITGYSDNAGYELSRTDPPILTITGGSEYVYYSIWEWLEDHATEVKPTDIKPAYLCKNGAWVKQNAYERQNGEWVQVSYAN